MLYVDPLPHALVLTSIVIGVGVTALALALAKRIRITSYNVCYTKLLRNHPFDEWT